MVELKVDDIFIFSYDNGSSSLERVTKVTEDKYLSIHLRDNFYRKTGEMDTLSFTNRYMDEVEIITELYNSEIGQLIYG